MMYFQPTIANPSLSINYSYSIVNNNDLFLILGYAAGGVAIVAVLVLMVMLFRKKRNSQMRNHNNQPEQNASFDISYFEELMPAVSITV